MKVPSRLLKPTAVLASNDATVASKYQSLLEKAGYAVERCRSMADALHLVDSALPHVVLTDSFLPDGHAGNLFDELQADRNKRRIAVLVHITSRNARDLTVLSRRAFAAIFHGEPLPKAFQAKLDEIELTHFDPPPFFLKAERIIQNTELKLRTKASLLGTFNSLLVFRTRVRLSARTSYLCSAVAPLKGATELTPRLCLKTVGGFYCFVPQEDVPKDAAWLSNLPLLAPPSAQRPTLPPPRPRRILFFHPDRDRYARLVQLLEGQSLEVLHADNLRIAALQYAEHPGRFGCVYLNELLTDRSKNDWLKAFSASDIDKPPLIVGTSGVPPTSSKSVTFLQQPVDPKALASLISASIDGREDGELPFDFGPHARSVVPCTFDVGARLIGFSDTCALIEHEAQILEGTDVSLDHAALGKIWSEQTRTRTEVSMPSPSGDGSWWSRLPVPAHGETKVAYWQRLAGLCGPRQTGDEEQAENPQSPAFNANVINVFIQSAYEVIEYYTGELPILGKPSVKAAPPDPPTPKILIPVITRSGPAIAAKPDDALPPRVAGMTAITGAAIEGYTSLVCDPQFVAMLAFRIAGVSKEQALADKDVLREVMEQLCDQIFGKARLFLESAGYVYDIALPTVRFGGDGKRVPLRGKPTIIIPFELNSERFVIDICFSQK